MPTRIRLFGDTQAADQYRFIAYRKVLADALKLRSFRNLPIFRHQVRIAGGGMIDVICHHNFNEISIYMPPREAPEREVSIQPGDMALLLLIGDEFIGYHGAVWDAFNNEQMSPLFTASKLEDIYNEYPPAKDQDDSFIQATQVGTQFYDFAVEGEWHHPPRLEDRIHGKDENDDGYLDRLAVEETDYSRSKSITYTHPTKGDITDTSRVEQQFVYPISSAGGCIGFDPYVNDDGSVVIDTEISWQCEEDHEGKEIPDDSRMEVWFEWGEWQEVAEWGEVKPKPEMIDNRYEEIEEDNVAAALDLPNSTDKWTFTKGDGSIHIQETLRPDSPYICIVAQFRCLDHEVWCEPTVSAPMYILRGDHIFTGPRGFLEEWGWSRAQDFCMRYFDIVHSRYTNPHIGQNLHSYILVNNVPSYEGKDHYDANDEDVLEVRSTKVITRFDKCGYEVSGSADYYEAHCGSHEEHSSWLTPIGALKRKRRILQQEELGTWYAFNLERVVGNKEDEWEFWQDEEIESKYDDIDDLPREEEEHLWFRGMIAPWNKNEVYGQNESQQVVFEPDKEEKDSQNRPSSDYNAIRNKTIEARHSEKGVGFQIYTTSFVEWVGGVNPDKESYEQQEWEQLATYDHTFVAASCGMTKDPRGQERSPDFEEAIASFIDTVTQDQRENEDIPEVNEHTSYRGYLHAYFIDRGIVNVFEQPRSRDAERLKLLNLVNQARKDEGLEPVKYSWDLEKAAIRFTFDMVEDLHIGHTGKDGSDAQQRQEETGFFINVGVHTTEMEDNENLPRGGWENTGYIEGDKSAEAIFDAWMDSDSHRANILDSRLDKNGAMGADYRLGSDGNYYWAQEFARNPNY